MKVCNDACLCRYIISQKVSPASTSTHSELSQGLSYQLIVLGLMERCHGGKQLPVVFSICVFNEFRYVLF